MSTVAEGLTLGADGKARCAWGAGDPLYMAYHDQEWGRPSVDDRYLFEKICLEGFQSGLSWLTILRKRENFRRAFNGFAPAAVAAMGPADVERLLQDAGIVRHRGKIESVLNNAPRAVALAEELGSLAAHLWRFEPEAAARPERFDWATLRPITRTPASLALSKDLRRRGWSFVGPTTMHAFMQATGMVNDHLDGCWCREACSRARRSLVVPG
jgi:DNA-3-methyladenine glycosylase I